MKKRINENTKITLTIKQLKRLVKENRLDGNVDAVNLCNSISRQLDSLTLSYDTVVDKLESNGFKLVEYGGEKVPYALYMNQDGILVTINYEWEETPLHDVAGDVTDFYWNDNAEYNLKEYGQYFD